MESKLEAFLTFYPVCPLLPYTTHENLPPSCPQHNPEKLSTVEDALARYKGREDILFQRLKKQYGKPIPA